MAEWFELSYKCYHFICGSGRDGDFTDRIKFDTLGEAMSKRIELRKQYRKREAGNFNKNDYWNERWSGDVKPIENPVKIYKITKKLISGSK